MSRKPPSHHWPARRQRAFTLVEIAVVVVILGVLIALTLPGYRKIRLKSQATAVTNDLRTFSAAFVNSNLQNAGWPPGGFGPGNIPTTMANALTNTFTKPSPIGGKYEWISNSTYKAAIGVTSDGADVLQNDLELLELVDRMIDDGNTSSGNVTISGPDLIYVIEP